MSNRGRDETVLIEALGSSPKMRIIDFFIDEQPFDFTKKEIIQELGMSNRTFYKYFPDIEKAGIVKESRKIGRAQLYTLNKESPVVKELIKLQDKLSERARQMQMKEKEEVEVAA